MARAEIPLIIIDPATGNAIVGASVAVKLRATGVSATVYAAETGATTVGNPRTSDANGRVSGWCDRGAYQFDISGTGLTSYTEYWDAATSGDGGLDTAWLADSAVTTAKIGAAQVTSAKMAAGASAATFVSSLPASPVDGQEVYYQSTTAGTGGGTTNSMADVGAIWHLRYRAASASTYKWEFIGGTTTSHQNGGGTTTCTVAFTGYAPSSWTSPTVKVPLAGTYNFTLQTNVTAQASGTTTANYQNLVGSTTGILVSQQQTVAVVNFFGTNYCGGLSGQDGSSTLVSGENLSFTQGSFTAGNTVTQNFVKISLTPIRVI